MGIINFLQKMNPLLTSIIKGKSTNSKQNDKVIAKLFESEYLAGNNSLFRNADSKNNISKQNVTHNRTMHKVKEERLSGHLITKIDNILIEKTWASENLKDQTKLKFSVIWNDNKNTFVETMYEDSHDNK